MKKIYLIIFTICIVSCSEKEVDFKSLVERNGVMYEINSDDPFSGIAMEVFDNKQIKFKGKYRKGLKNGTWKYYLENGQTTIEENYSEGKLDGNYIKFNPNGSKEQEGSYIIGKRNGAWKNYYKDKLIKSSTYKNDKLNGLVIDYILLNNGEYYKSTETNYKEGKQDGISQSFDKNGKVLFKTNYKNGAKDGLEEVFLSSGNKISEIVYKSDTTKKRKDWNNDGELTFECQYPGTCIWYKNGKKNVEVYFYSPNKVKDSSLKVWFKNGIFTPNELLKDKWQGQRHYKSANGFSPEQNGFVYYHFNNNNLYRKVLYYTAGYFRGHPRSRISTLNHGNWELNIYSLPNISLSIKPSKRSYSNEYLNITDFNGNTLTVNSKKWKRVPLDNNY